MALRTIIAGTLISVAGRQFYSQLGLSHTSDTGR
jgi:hypothetical protein